MEDLHKAINEATSNLRQAQKVMGGMLGIFRKEMTAKGFDFDAELKALQKAVKNNDIEGIKDLQKKYEDAGKTAS